MTEPFVSSEVDRTKSKWVAGVYREFGRTKTTLRALFYYCLQRPNPDYPICGGFVGEIRVTRPYHQSDGEKLAKWAGKAQKLGLVPEDAFLPEEAKEEVFLPEAYPEGTPRLELWLNRSTFNPLLRSVCNKHHAVLVSAKDPSGEPVAQLFRRAIFPTTVLCLSDLSRDSFSFSRDLAFEVAGTRDPGAAKITVLHAAITPEQVLNWKIPMVSENKGGKAEQKEYRIFLKAFSLDDRKKAELDALEVHYPRGIAGFADDILARHIQSGQ